MDHPAKGIQMIGPLSTKNGVVADAMVHLKSLAANATFRDKWMPPEAWAKALDVKFGVEYSKRNVSKALNGLESNQSFPNPNDAKETIAVQAHHFNVSIEPNKESKRKFFFLFRLSTTNQENVLVAAKSKDLWQKAYHDAMAFVRPSGRHERIARKRQRHNELSKSVSKRCKETEAVPAFEPSPPNIRQEAIEMARIAWEAHYGSKVCFPFELFDIAAFTIPNSPCEVSDQETLETSDCGETEALQCQDRIKCVDVILPNGRIVRDVPNTYSLIPRNSRSKLEEKAWLIDSLQRHLKRGKSELTKINQTVLGGFQADHPKVPPETMSQIIALGRWTLLSDWKAFAEAQLHKHNEKAESESEKKNWVFPEAFVSVDKIWNVSPGVTWLTECVVQTAADQALCAGQKMRQAKAVYCQETSKGTLIPKASKFGVRMLTLFFGVKSSR